MNSWQIPPAGLGQAGMADPPAPPAPPVPVPAPPMPAPPVPTPPAPPTPDPPVAVAPPAPVGFAPPALVVLPPVTVLPVGSPPDPPVVFPPVVVVLPLVASELLPALAPPAPVASADLPKSLPWLEQALAARSSKDPAKVHWNVMAERYVWFMALTLDESNFCCHWVCASKPWPRCMRRAMARSSLQKRRETMPPPSTPSHRPRVAEKAQ